MRGLIQAGVIVIKHWYTVFWTSCFPVDHLRSGGFRGRLIGVTLHFQLIYSTGLSCDQVSRMQVRRDLNLLSVLHLISGGCIRSPRILCSLSRDQVSRMHDRQDLNLPFVLCLISGACISSPRKLCKSVPFSLIFWEFFNGHD